MGVKVQGLGVSKGTADRQGDLNPRPADYGKRGKTKPVESFLREHVLVVGLKVRARATVPRRPP
jgi:hypothetical protein